MKPTLHWAEIGESSLLWGMRPLFGVYRFCGRRVLQVFLYPVAGYSSSPKSCSIDQKPA